MSLPILAWLTSVFHSLTYSFIAILPETLVSLLSLAVSHDTTPFLHFLSANYCIFLPTPTLSYCIIELLNPFPPTKYYIFRVTCEDCQFSWWECYFDLQVRLLFFHIIQSHFETLSVCFRLGDRTTPTNAGFFFLHPLIQPTSLQQLPLGKYSCHLFTFSEVDSGLDYRLHLVLYSFLIVPCTQH